MFIFFYYAVRKWNTPIGYCSSTAPYFTYPSKYEKLPIFKGVIIASSTMTTGKYQNIIAYA